MHIIYEISTKEAKTQVLLSLSLQASPRVSLLMYEVFIAQEISLEKDLSDARRLASVQRY